MAIQAYQHISEGFFSVVRDKLEGTRGAGVDIKQLQTSYASASKKLSQLIAQSWLQKDVEGSEGHEFRQILLRHNSEEIKDFLKNKHSINIDDLFQAVSDGPVDVKVSWDTFGGKTDEELRLYVLPYPPRPSEVTDAQLEKWVNDINPEQIFPLDPYIPLTFF